MARTNGPWLVAALAAALLAGGLASVAPRLAERVEPLDPDRAAAAARRAAAVFASAEQVWARRLDAEFGRAYAPAEFVAFARATDAACGRPGPASGHFYCPASRRVAIDLAALDAVARGLRRDGDFGAMLVVARVAAEHAQAAVAPGPSPAGRASAVAADRARTLEGDCFVGVWVRAALPAEAARPALYARAVEAARGIDANRPRGSAPRVDPGLFGDAEPEVRAEAFARGLQAPGLADCAGAG